MNTDTEAAGLVDERPMPLHADALAWIDALVLDLKLQLLGAPEQMSAPITMERLGQWHGDKKHRRDIERCKDESGWRR